MNNLILNIHFHLKWNQFAQKKDCPALHISIMSSLGGGAVSVSLATKYLLFWLYSLGSSWPLRKMPVGDSHFLSFPLFLLHWVARKDTSCLLKGVILIRVTQWERVRVRESKREWVSTVSVLYFLMENHIKHQLGINRNVEKQPA